MVREKEEVGVNASGSRGLAIVKDSAGLIAPLSLAISFICACFTGWGLVESHQNSRLVNRPFIAVTATSSGEHDVNFALHSGGATAAMSVAVDAFCSYDTHRRWDSEYSKNYPDDAFTDQMYSRVDQHDLMLPGMTKSFHCSTDIPERPLNALPPGRAVSSRYLRGVVTYVDVYGSPHKSRSA